MKPLPVVMTALAMVVASVLTVIPSVPASTAVVIPESGNLEVTGFAHVGVDGSSGPITVVVRGARAERLRSALDHASTFSTTAVCHEDLEPFVIKFMASHQTHPTVVARAFECGGPGVALLKDGKLSGQVMDDCAVQASVAAALPHGKANGTRQALALMCPSIAGGCKSESTSLRVAVVGQIPTVCLRLRSTLKLTFDKSHAGTGTAGTWSRRAIEITPKIMKVKVVKIKGSELTVTLTGVSPGQATVRALFNQVCTGGSTTPCTIPPLGVFTVSVIVAS